MSFALARTTSGALLAPDPTTGELLSLAEASDCALVEFADRVAEADRDLRAARVALALEMRERYGVGSADVAGFRVQVSEARSWPKRATAEALEFLVETGAIPRVDADRAMPAKPAPDGRALGALLTRLMHEAPDAAKRLADACTVSPASARVERVAVDAEAAAPRDLAEGYGTAPEPEGPVDLAERVERAA